MLLQERVPALVHERPGLAACEYADLLDVAVHRVAGVLMWLARQGRVEHRRSAVVYQLTSGGNKRRRGTRGWHRV